MTPLGTETGPKQYRGIHLSARPGTQWAVLKQLQWAGVSGPVLDAPAGAGAITQCLLDHGLEVVAGDLGGREYLAQAPLLKLDLNKPAPFADGSFAAVVCVEGLEHLESHWFTLREFHRVLRPGGVLVVATPNPTAAWSRLRFLATGFVQGRRRPPVEFGKSPGAQHLNLVDFSLLRFMLRATGFELCHYQGLGIQWTAAWFYLLYPLFWPFNWRTYAKAKDPRQKAIHAEVARAMWSKDLVLGANYLVRARRVG